MSGRHMIRRLQTGLALALVLSLPLAAEAARPLFGSGQFEIPPPQQQSLVRPSGVSMEQAASMVQRQTGGRVLSTTAVDRGFEVRVLVDGKRVKKVFVDSRGNIRGAD